MKRDVDRVREDRTDGKDMEECNVESSAYECIRLFVEERRSLIKRRKSVGDRMEPQITLLLVGKGGDVEPSTIMEIEQSERSSI